MDNNKGAEMLKDIPYEIRIGGLSEIDYKRMSVVRDNIMEPESVEKLLGLKRVNSERHEKATIEEFLSTLEENPEKTYLFGLSQEDGSYSLSGAAFFVPETGRNLAFGTLESENTKEQNIFNLNLIYKEGYVEPLHKKYPIEKANVYFYRMSKESI